MAFIQCNHVFQKVSSAASHPALRDAIRYHHEDRTHLGLEKGTPEGRIRSVASGRVHSQERLGGLHHRYNRAA